MSESGTRSFEPVAAFAAIARALTESLELPEVLRRIASETLALTAAQGVSIIMPRGEVAEYVAHESAPPHSLIPVGFQFRPPPQLVAALARQRDPFVILDLQSSPLIPGAIKERVTVRDLVIVPLRVDGELMGALVIAFRQLPEDWPWDPALLRAVGDQAAVAVRNARLYEAARRTGEQLVQAEQLTALGRVVAHVAHQLNNPLTTARLLTESLEVEPLPVAALEQVRAVGREVDRAATVVRDLLLFARKGRRAFATVTLPEVVRGAVAEHERHLAAAGVAVAMEFSPALPAVPGDAHALRQVFSNLLHNALQALATAPGERRITLRARAEEGEAGHFALIEVEDTGPGIPAEALSRIFEPFFTTKPVGEGTGLGLSIVKEIIEVHGGLVEAGNTPAGGAVFRLRLPVAEAAPDATTPESAPAPAAAGSRVPRGLRVLVIDDEAGLQSALRRVLQHLGCEVVSALTGEEGFEQAGRMTFDLILCDIRIPDLAGREIYERLAAEAPHALRVLAFMTGDTLSDEIRRFLDSTGRPALAKPFGRVQIQALLRLVTAEGA